jgi:hypothetical protein
MADGVGSADQLSPAAARSIIESLADGVVPRVGAHLFTAGRERWLHSLDEDLEDLGDQDSRDGRLRILNGRNGDGKTHLMHLFRQQAFQAGFVVSYVVISDDVPLYRWDLVYREIGRSLSTQCQPDSPGLRAIVNPRSPDPAIADTFVSKAVSIRSMSGVHPSFAEVLYRYCTEQTVNIDAEQDMLLLGSWLEGYGQRLSGMGIVGTVDRANGSAMLRSLARMLGHFGFRGLVVLVDEVESVLNLTAPRRRESYQTLRLLVDRENTPAHTLIMASTTPPMFTDPDRGMSTYPALWSRVRPESHSDFVNYHATLIDLPRTPLSQPNYMDIARCIRAIHARARNWAPSGRVPDAFLTAAALVAAAGRLTLTYSPTRVFVKLIADTLELAHQHPEFAPSIEDLQDRFGDVDQRLVEAEAARRQVTED